MLPKVSSEEEAPSEPIRIVIAEDQTLLREATRRVLDAEPDLDVVGEARDGEEAVSLTERMKPDIAIVDMAMPKLNGVEVTRLIKEARAATAVLILSAYDDDAYVFASLEAGAAGYLLKDIRSRELVDAVRAVARGESVLHPTVARKVLQRFVGPERSSKKADLDELTKREVDVLRLAAQGLSNREIGLELLVSPRTVQIHLGHVFEKMGVASRTEAVVKGLRTGLLNLDDLA